MTGKKRQGGFQGMIKAKTAPDEALLRRLQDAAKRVLTKDELRAQRVSFAYGNLPQDSSTVSRARVEEVIAKIEGETAAA